MDSVQENIHLTDADIRAQNQKYKNAQVKQIQESSLAGTLRTHLKDCVVCVYVHGSIALTL